MNNIIIYGFHSINYYLNNNFNKIKIIYINEKRNDLRLKKIFKIIIYKNINFLKVSKKYLFFISKTNKNQGIVAIIKKNDKFHNINSIIKKNKKNLLLLILDGITDNNNLGSCLRVANAAGVHAVITSKNRSIFLNSISTKISSGSSFSIPYIIVNNLILFIKKLKKKKILIIGLTEKTNKNLYEINLNKPIALIVGSENKGIRELTKKNCDILVKIPMFGFINNLNVSVASGICLYEVKRQRIL